jgi:hypothetical protein
VHRGGVWKFNGIVVTRLPDQQVHVLFSVPSTPFQHAMEHTHALSITNRKEMLLVHRLY